MLTNSIPTEGYLAGFACAYIILKEAGVLIKYARGGQNGGGGGGNGGSSTGSMGLNGGGGGNGGGHGSRTEIARGIESELKEMNNNWGRVASALERIATAFEFRGN